MTSFHAVILGLVQGLTEFIPVSSTAHLRIVPALLGWEDPGAAFSAVIQLGTLAAVLVYFAQDIWRLSVAAVMWPLTRGEAWREDGRLAWAIAAGNVPIVAFGLAGRHFIETQARSLYLIATMLILVALALAWVERRAATSPRPAPAAPATPPRKRGGELLTSNPAGSAASLGIERLTLRRVLVIGLFQALALIPGASRSGVTILGGLWLGMRRAEAARFSFLLGIPAILGAALFELRSLAGELEAGSGANSAALGLALLAAFISGYASIGFLLRYLKTRTTMVFVGYRIGLGLMLLALVWLGWIQ
jgi:undecaprenyl-diphosphatase